MNAKNDFNHRPYSARQLPVLAAELSLIGLVGFLCAQSLFVAFSPSSLPVFAKREIPELGQSSNTPFKPLANAHKPWLQNDPFFREFRAALPEQVGQNAPETTLKLKLYGRRSGENGSAIISTPDSVQRTYKAGAEIINNVVLASVHKDYVVLSRNGQLERLTFERIAKPNSLSSMPPLAKVGMNNMDILSLVRLNPARRGGRIIGFTVYPKSASVDIRKLGLMPGDIITKVGNEDFSSGLPKISDLAAQLRGRSLIQVTVLRSGTPITLQMRKP